MLRTMKQLMLFVGLLLVFTATAAENTASIAVASDASDPEASISEKAARAAYFLYFDDQGHFMTAERNPFAGASGGAGPKAVDFLSTKGVSSVVAGEFGNKMMKTLDLHNITYHQRSGVAHEVVQAVIVKK